ncbi:uncharacterized protein BDV17DRAFT_90263 [Aspergillus undulatus]|uniref:uncharacterized protein n=1 Tax=Aspergillus undulatus TaxID=1810928 RepID=UPI003CCDCAFF
MKASLITLIAALSASAMAAPTQVTKSIESTATKALDMTFATATATKAAEAAGDGHIVQNLGGQVNDVLEITGPNAQRLLLQLSPEVAGLLSSLGLGGLGAPVGSIVASASSVGELLTNLGPDVEGLLVVIGEGGDYLLVSLAPGLAGLLSGLGLPSLGTPVGSIVATLGQNLKRDMVVGDLIPKVRDILEVTGSNAERLLIQLSPETASLVTGLGLPQVGEPVGEIVDEASSVGELVNHTGAPAEQLLTVVGKDSKALLIKLSPSVAKLLSGLGLTGVGASVGSIVATLGANL